MFGAIVGDIVGSVYEFDNIKTTEFPLFSAGSEPTDDSVMTLGGRVAEEMVNGEISTGALNDLEKLTRQAYAMVTYFGMSDKIGNVSYYDSTGRSEMSLSKPYSEKTAEEIDKEVKRLIDKAHDTATKVLKEHREGFEQLAALLLEREVIFSEDVERILGPRKGGVNPNAVLDAPAPAKKEEVQPAEEPVIEIEEPAKPAQAAAPESPVTDPVAETADVAEVAEAAEEAPKVEEKPRKPRRKSPKKDSPTLF